MKDREYIKFLEDRGYKRYSPSVIDGEGVTDCFQKRFDDEKGKKYFINVKRWDFSRFSIFQSVPDPISYPADVQLYKKGTHAAMNIEFFSDWKIEDVEEHVEWLFNSGRFDYYEEW